MFQHARIEVDGKVFELTAPAHRKLTRSEVRDWLRSRAVELTRSDDAIRVVPDAGLP